MFTAPLHSNGSYSTVACVFVAAGTCFLSSCLAMDVSSDFTIAAFGRHVTISISTFLIMKHENYIHIRHRLRHSFIVLFCYISILPLLHLNDHVTTAQFWRTNRKTCPASFPMCSVTLTKLKIFHELSFLNNAFGLKCNCKMFDVETGSYNRYFVREN
jgi:hypothetical protein